MRRLIFLLVLASASMAQAQTHYHHNNFWSRTIIQDRITDKLKWELFWQLRTQNDAEDKLNIFKHHQLTSYWAWLHYQPTKDLKISLTPFCYFNTIALFPQSTELGNRGVNEFRWAVMVEHIHRFKKINYANRYSLEYRFRDLFTPDEYIGNFRVRYRARFERPLKKIGKDERLLSAIVYDEVFLEFDPRKKASPAFNQNRLYAGFGYELAKNVKFSLGYMYLYQARPTGTAEDHSNVLWAMITFDNVFSQFRKKEQEIK